MADNKYSMRDMAADLARRSNIDTPHAEDFAKAFVDTIMDGLHHDNMVKIKGFGTFKLISVESRESINVNTGERFMIEGHTKVSFTPDPVLRDEINKPFADFQTVALNDGIELSDFAPEPEPEPEAEEETVVLPEPEAETDSETTSETEQQELAEAEPGQGIQPEPMPVVESEPEQEQQDAYAEHNNMEPETHEAMPEIYEEEPEAEPETATIEQEEPEPQAETGRIIIMQDPDPEPEPQQQTEETAATADSKATSRASRTHHIMALIVAVLLCMLSYVAGYYRWFDPCPMSQQATDAPAKAVVPDAATAQEQLTDEKADGKADMPSQSETIKKEAPEPTPVYPQLNGGAYRITGIKGKHTLKRGQSLRQVSIEYYGTNEFAPYIVVLNKIENPDIVPIGMELLLPELEAADNAGNE